MDLKWMIDWEEAKKHPWKTRALLFVGFTAAALATLFVAGANFGDHAGALVLTCAAVGLLAALAGDLPEGSIRERVQLSARARVVLGAAAVALGLTAAALVDSYFPVVVTVVLCVFLVPNRRKRSGTN